MFMKISTIHDLIKHHIADLVSAEKQLISALPDMVEAATDPELVDLYNKHLVETKTHLERLNEVADLLTLSIEEHTCKGMQGLLEEGKDAIAHITNAELLDKALLLGSRKIEHYEILGYNDLLSHLKNQNQECVSIVNTTLKEEINMDDNLGDLSDH